MNLLVGTLCHRWSLVRVRKCGEEFGLVGMAVLLYIQKSAGGSQTEAWVGKVPPFTPHLPQH